MRTESKYKLDTVSVASCRLKVANRRDRSGQLAQTDPVENYFRKRPTLQDAGLSEALYRVGALAANDLRRQNPDAAATEAGCSINDDLNGEATDAPADDAV